MSDDARVEVEKFMAGLIRRNPGEPEFHQAVREVVGTVTPFVLEHRRYHEAKILERMTDCEDAQGLARKVSAIVFRGPCELELQGPFAGMPHAGATKVFAARTLGVVTGQGCVNGVVEQFSETARVIEVQRQNGTSGNCCLLAAAISRILS